MGVPCMNEYLRRSRFKTNIVLKDMTLIIDATDAMYWFVKTKFLRAMVNLKVDQFGFNMVAYAQFLRGFFSNLIEDGNRLIIVYNGARPSESQYGSMVSKRDHLDKSSRIAHLKLKQERLNEHDIIPPLAVNILKRVVLELIANTAHQSSETGARIGCVQAPYEVYGYLEKLSNEHRCPVITSHADFLFADTSYGFMLFEDLQLPANAYQSDSSSLSQQNQPRTSIICESHYQNQQFFTECRIRRDLIKTLWVLMRPDFSGRYYSSLNEIIGLRGSDGFVEDDNRFHEGRRPRRNFNGFGRLKAVINKWPSLRINSLADLRRRLRHYSSHMLRDFDVIYDSFMNTDAIELPGNFNYNEILARSESSLSFYADLLMSQTIFNRGTIEDKDTFRSTFSMIDPVRMHINQQFLNKNPGQVLLLDRRRIDLSERYALPLPERILQGQMTMYKLFNFPTRTISRESLGQALESLRIRPALKSDYFEQLFVVLRIVQSSFLFAWNSTHSNDLNQPRNPIASSYKELELLFQRAVYNSMIYYLYKNHRDLALDLNELENNPNLIQDPKADREGLLPQMRLAVDEISGKIMKIGISYKESNYFKIKHLIELLNHSLHGYCELGAILNGVKLALDKYYDATLVYKIMKYLLMHKSDKKINLLGLDDDLKNLLLEPPATAVNTSTSS